MDAGFYAWQLRRYSGTHRYTAAILAYVFGAGAFMAGAAPNFGGLFKRQQLLEGKAQPGASPGLLCCYCCCRRTGRALMR